MGWGPKDDPNVGVFRRTAPPLADRLLLESPLPLAFQWQNSCSRIIKLLLSFNWFPSWKIGTYVCTFYYTKKGYMLIKYPHQRGCHESNVDNSVSPRMMFVHSGLLSSLYINLLLLLTHISWIRCDEAGVSFMDQTLTSDCSSTAVDLSVAAALAVVLSPCTLLVMLRPITRSLMGPKRMALRGAASVTRCLAELLQRRAADSARLVGLLGWCLVPRTVVAGWCLLMFGHCLSMFGHFTNGSISFAQELWPIIFHAWRTCSWLLRKSTQHQSL